MPVKADCIMGKIIRRTALILVCLVVVTLAVTRLGWASDPFLTMATNPSFMRDVHLISAGWSSVGSAKAEDDQNTGISNQYLLAASNIWNNEHNQILAGVQYGRRALDKQLALPDGLVMPDRLDNAALAIGYKHITSGDWSISQSVRYNRAWTDSPSITIRDTFDLVGLAAISHEPGVVWAFGYAYIQTDTSKDQIYPIVEYINYAHARWTVTLGYPFLNFAFSPHPDILVGGISISYKVTEQNIVRLSYGTDNWAYRLEGPNVKSSEYTAQKVGLDWTYLYCIDHRTIVILNADLGWEFDRELGADNKLSLDNAVVMGFNASLSF